MKGFMRNVEVVLAILLVLTTFQFFLRWDQFRDVPASADRSAYELLRAQGSNLRLALFEPAELDSLIKQSLPSNLNYKMELEYLSPFDYRGVENGSQVICLPYEFPPGTDVESIALYGTNSFPIPTETRSNWYRQPFLIDTSDNPISNEVLSVTFSLPYVDSNSDGIIERPAKDSLELHVGAEQTPFRLTSFVDGADSTSVELAFNATIPKGRLVKSYLYYQVGEWDEG